MAALGGICGNAGTTEGTRVDRQGPEEVQEGQEDCREGQRWLGGKGRGKGDQGMSAEWTQGLLGVCRSLGGVQSIDGRWPGGCRGGSARLWCHKPCGL
jgi:hypothetical protein